MQNTFLWVYWWTLKCDSNAAVTGFAYTDNYIIFWMKIQQRLVAACFVDRVQQFEVEENLIQAQTHAHFSQSGIDVITSVIVIKMGMCRIIYSDYELIRMSLIKVLSLNFTWGNC